MNKNQIKFYIEDMLDSVYEAAMIEETKELLIYRIEELLL